MPDGAGFYDVLKQAASAANVPLTHIGPRMGKASTYVNGAISRGSVPTVDNAAAMLGACGWALVAVPRDEIPAGGMEIGAPVDVEEVERRALERRRDRLRRELAETEELLG